MEVSPSKFGLAISLVVGISGIFLITRAKTGNTDPDDSRTTSIVPNLILLHRLKLEEEKQAEIIGDYIAEGLGGKVFRLPSGDVMKIVSLEKKNRDLGHNLAQTAFIEDLWVKKLRGQNPFSPEFAQIKHYHRGYAGPRMTELVNGEGKSFGKDLKVGEKVAYWVMEYIPTIGRGEMSQEQIDAGKNRLAKWGEKHGYELTDLKDANFGQRNDGTFVAFDPWPHKISKEVNDSLDR